VARACRTPVFFFLELYFIFETNQSLSLTTKLIALESAVKLVGRNGVSTPSEHMFPFTLLGLYLMIVQTNGRNMVQKKDRCLVFRVLCSLS